MLPTQLCGIPQTPQQKSAALHVYMPPPILYLSLSFLFSEGTQREQQRVNRCVCLCMCVCVCMYDYNNH